MNLKLQELLSNNDCTRKEKQSSARPELKLKIQTVDRDKNNLTEIEIYRKQNTKRN